MSNTNFRKLEDILPRDIVPGFAARFIHTANNTISILNVKAGMSLPVHSHMHEQCSFVLEGEFEMTIDGETKILNPGIFAVIPAHVPHGGRAITDCKLFDVFSPVREDYR